MKYEEFSFDSFVEGQKIFTRLYIPNETPRGILQITHGMAEHSALYDEFCKYLASEGYVAAIFDNLGHGRSVSAGGDFGHFFEGGLDNVVSDSKKLYGIIKARFPNIPYFVMGHSMGSFIVRDFITKYGTELSGAIIMGTGAGMRSSKWLLTRRFLKSKIQLKGSKGRSKTVAQMSTAPYVKHFKKGRTVHDWVTSDEAEVDKYANDPMCGFALTVSGYLHLGEMLQRVNSREWYERVPKNLPILMISGMEDAVGDMGKGVRRVAAQLVKTEHECELILYPGIRHALVTERNKEQVFSDIKYFMDYKILRKSKDEVMRLRNVKNK